MSRRPENKKRAQDERARPGRFHSRYWVLRLLFEELTRIVESDLLRPGERLLDYGCGNKPYAALFSRRFTAYVGADFRGNKAADIVIGPHGELPVEDNFADCVLSTQVLEHVEDPKTYLAEAYRVLKPGGTLILSTHGVWQFHPDPTDYWRWTVDGLQAEIYRAGFDICRMRSVLGMASSGMQLWQDGTARSVPRLLRPLYFWCIQSMIGLIEKRPHYGLSSDACVYIVAASKRSTRDLSGPDLETHRLDVAQRELQALIPPETSFILIDECEWVKQLGMRRYAMPFLERDGQYWGRPANDRQAIQEVERSRRSGARFVVFARPAFWWLDYYSGFHRHLRENHVCVLENDRLVAFDLRTQGCLMDEKSTDEVATPPQHPVSPDAVQAFYDEFSVSRMQRYLEKGNLRIDRAIERILPLVASDSQILEIGCGIGLVTERMAKAAPHGMIWGYDISQKSIQQAKERVQAPNVQFRRGDILRDFDDLRARITARIHLVVMVDVIEHLPLADHSALLRELATIMRPDALMILTFPSAEYQRHLREASPEELQIIDEVIELEHVLSIATSNGLRVKHFSLEDVWLRNQYVHCILAKSLSLERL